MSDETSEPPLRERKPQTIPAPSNGAPSVATSEPVSAPPAPLVPPGPGGTVGDPTVPGPVKTAAQLFQEAREKAQAALSQGMAGKPVVDKYFGTKLPPVCKQLGCYVTDDGKFFYCINPNCHKDRKRETKYNRRRRALVYFFCPKCKSREIQLHLKVNNYECLDCAYTWKQ